MGYLNEPLNPFRPVSELSPFKLAIHRTIREPRVIGAFPRASAVLAVG